MPHLLIKYVHMLICICVGEVPSTLVLFHRSSSLVGCHSKKSYNNKSTKFGIFVEKYIINRSGYWAITIIAPVGIGSCFKMATDYFLKY